MDMQLGLWLIGALCGLLWAYRLMIRLMGGRTWTASSQASDDWVYGRKAERDWDSG